MPLANVGMRNIESFWKKTWTSSCHLYVCSTKFFQNTSLFSKHEKKLWFKLYEKRISLGLFDFVINFFSYYTLVLPKFLRLSKKTHSQRESIVRHVQWQHPESLCTIFRCLRCGQCPCGTSQRANKPNDRARASIRR